MNFYEAMKILEIERELGKGVNFLKYQRRNMKFRVTIYHKLKRAYISIFNEDVDAYEEMFRIEYNEVYPIMFSSIENDLITEIN